MLKPFIRFISSLFNENESIHLHLHSFKIDFEKANDNKILLEKLLNNQKYIDFILNDEDISKII
jgi:hypothetical protein